jgi:hypothetical protein
MKKKYTYRVKVEKICSCILYLQENLPIVPGKTRSAKIDGYSFPNMPVYSLGGKSLTRLFHNYKSLHTEDERIGRPNFMAMAKLLCTKGKMKTGLSSYYVRLRDVGNITIWFPRKQCHQKMPFSNTS